MSLLITVAGIVTPLGLYDGIWADKIRVQSFEYAPDASVFGQGTPARSPLGFNRQCGRNLPRPCPLSNTVLTVVSNDTLGQAEGTVDGNVPQILLDSYSSGTVGTTVSNCFDILWRQWSTKTDNIVNDGKPYLTGSLRQITSLILDNAVQPVEGLIVDTANGGIGFRNHTIPTQVQQSTSWDEDLLFVQPESYCLNNNVTIDFTITGNNSLGRLVMTDRGGFANLNKTYPAYLYTDLDDPQRNPNLERRAYKAAWLTNAFTMLYWNITNIRDNKTSHEKTFSYMNSTVGKEFGLRVGNEESSPFNAIKLDSTWGRTGLTGDSSLEDIEPGSVNPYGLTSSNWSTISTLRHLLSDHTTLY